jgi:hypothetical protein
MRSTQFLAAAGAALGALVSVGCNGVAMPGRTAGNTWGGSHSHAAAAKKEEPKAEPKKESKAKTYPPGAPGPYDRTGLITRVKDDRLWIFRDRTKDLADFDKGTPSEKHVTLVGEGPNGMTVKAPDAETIEAW